MKNKSFLPEGRLIGKEENKVLDMAAARAAMAQNRRLEGYALRCDPGYNLTVKFNKFTGIIPRGEVVLNGGKRRDTAIITRVGNPVCFKIIDIDDSGGFTLSRCAAQREAMDYFMESLSRGDVIDATVTHIEPFGVFVDMGCGISSMIGVENISVSRISHPAEHFYIGQEIKAVVTGVDKERERINLSHKELLGTWTENAAKFSKGDVVSGKVRGVKPYGAFIELAPNLSGLAEPSEELREGDAAAVYIKAIIPEKKKIKLTVVRKLQSPDLPENTVGYYINEGNIGDWKY